VISSISGVRAALRKRREKKEKDRRPFAYLPAMVKGAEGDGGDGGSPGSATGHPAPNAGQVGHAPTFDLDKKPRRRRRVKVTKTAAFEAGVKTAVDWKRTAIIAGAAGTGILAIYDIMKARGYADDIKIVRQAIVGGKLVDSRKFVELIDPKIEVVWTEHDIRRAMMNEPSIPNLIARVNAKTIARTLAQGQNAFALPGERGAYIFVPKRCNAQVLAHEIGHILDFRGKGLNIRNPGPYKKRLSMLFWKPRYEKSVMTPEREAWRQAPGRKTDTELERSALGTYEKGFHINRATFAGMGAAILASSLAKAASTVGEHERDVSSPGVTGGNYVGQRVDERVERRPGNQGGRGVPEWLRLLKKLPSKDTWNGGDAVKVPATDNQFEVPYAST